MSAAASGDRAFEFALPQCGLRGWRGGNGPTIVVFHRDTGPTGWSSFHEALGDEFDVVALALPGFAPSDRPMWLRSVPQLATLCGQALHAMGLRKDCLLVGLGFGGWVAAELAAQSTAGLAGLVLHAPAGVRPNEGEILDQFLINETDYVRHGFRDEATFIDLFGAEPSEPQRREWDSHREMTERIAWSPYLFNLALPWLLRGVDLRTLILWGDADRLIPRSCADIYASAIPQSELLVVEGLGHQADLEFPDVLAKHVRSFAAEVLDPAAPNGRG